MRSAGPAPSKKCAGFPPLVMLADFHPPRSARWLDVGLGEGLSARSFELPRRRRSVRTDAGHEPPAAPAGARLRLRADRDRRDV
jgi:hypothetical protein